MLIIQRYENESIERMLRRYRRKHRNVKLRDELRNRQQFTKPSVRRRNEILKAQYINKKQKNGEG